MVVTQPALSVTVRLVTQRLPGAVDELTKYRKLDEVSPDEAEPIGIPMLGSASFGSTSDMPKLTPATPSGSAMS